MSASLKLLQPLIKKPLFLAIKTSCPYCRNAKALAKQNEVPAEIIEINNRDDGADIQKTLTELTKQTTVPYVYSNGKFIGGFTELAKQPDSFWEALKK